MSRYAWLNFVTPYQSFSVYLRGRPVFSEVENKKGSQFFLSTSTIDCFLLVRMYMQELHVNMVGNTWHEFNFYILTYMYCFGDYKCAQYFSCCGGYTPCSFSPMVTRSSTVKILMVLNYLFGSLVLSCLSYRPSAVCHCSSDEQSFLDIHEGQEYVLFLFVLESGPNMKEHCWSLSQKKNQEIQNKIKMGKRNCRYKGMKWLAISWHLDYDSRILRLSNASFIIYPCVCQSIPMEKYVLPINTTGKVQIGKLLFSKKVILICFSKSLF